MIRLKDVEAAERRVDEAMAALHRYNDNPSAWMAHEKLNDRDLRQLVIHRGHFEKLEMLQLDVEAALNGLRAVQQAFAGGS